MERNTVIGSFLKVQNPKSKVQSLFKNQRPKTKDQTQSGFSLLELMIAMFIMIILLSIALPAYQRTVQHARETVLKENLWQMRRAIDQFTADKGKLPQSLDDLVSNKYLHEKPVDPISEKSDWNEIQGEDKNSPDGGQGLVNIKSLAEGTDSDEKQFADY